MFTQVTAKSGFIPEAIQKEFKNTVGKITKAYQGYNRLREVDRISRHFSQFFRPVIGSGTNLFLASARIRHQVFCEELSMFDESEDGLETDFYDSYSQHCLIQHKASKNYAGTLRLVTPEDKSQILPICKIASRYITDLRLHPERFEPEQTLEVSRVSIPKYFRRRHDDQHASAALGGIDTSTYSETELRCFPLISVGLYMASAAYSSLSNRKHVYFMADPKVAKSMRHIGIRFEQIGDEFEYAGTRAPFYMHYDDFVSGLKPSFKSMLETFKKTYG
jgi:N-acyl amino acid synthase of PEP-CTERM/exosortase system